MEQKSGDLTLSFKYDSKEERDSHVIEMEKLGFNCDGQVSETDTFGGERYPFARFYMYVSMNPEEISKDELSSSISKLASAINRNKELKGEGRID